jgi:hypothetical protein
VLQAPRSVPQLPVASPRRRRRRWPIAVAALVALAALGLAAWRWWPESAPEALAVESVQSTLDPSDGAGSCPSASYTVSATVTTNGGPGTLQFAWELPDGRTSAARSVDVVQGQRRVDLSLDFELTGPTALAGSPVLVLTAPAEQRVDAPPVAYTC